MEFKKEDENYIYNVIGANVKKYRKQKGLTQVQLAEKINYSLSFIAGVESKKHQTFSLGALWRISLILGVDMYKLCIDENSKENEIKSVKYKCDKCGATTDIPIAIFETFSKLNILSGGTSKAPIFNCIKCDGKMKAVFKED